MPIRAKPTKRAPSGDPELTRQLVDARQSGAPVSAVFRLKPKGRATTRATAKARAAAPPVPEPKETEAAAKKLLERVTKKTGQPPDRFNVFRNLGSFVVSGSPSLISELMAQPEIAGAVANRRPGEDLLIRPVKRARPAPFRKKTARSPRSKL